MYRLMVLFAGIFIIFYSGCKGENDILVTYNKGQITRGEFYNWIKFRKMSKASVLKKKSQQRRKLQHIALNRLTVIEAGKSGYDKSDDFLYIMSHVKRNYYANYLLKKMRKEGSFNEKTAHVKIIKLIVKNYKIDKNRRLKLNKNELKNEVQKKLDEAGSIISKLGKGEDFEKLAIQYSEDFSKKKGGDIGYISRGMRRPEFTDAVFSLKKGEHLKEPVEISNSIYIIKIEDMFQLTEKNIKTYINDKEQRKRVSGQLKMLSLKRFKKDLMNADDIINRINLVEANNPSSLIIGVGEFKFSVADLNKFIGFIKKINIGRNKNFDKRMKKRLVGNILRDQVLMREALKRHLDKEPEFINDLHYYRGYNLAGAYKNSIISDITVSHKEMMDSYNRNRESVYTRKMKKGNKIIKKVIIFNEARDGIKRKLLSAKRNSKIKKWDSELLKKNNFKIFEDELEGE